MHLKKTTPKAFILFFVTESRKKNCQVVCIESIIQGVSTMGKFIKNIMIAHERFFLSA